MAPSPTERLLVALLKADQQSTAALSSFLSASHASHAALSAYASANPPPVGDVLREIEAALRGVHEAVRGYVGAMEAWATEMGEVRDREEEVGAVRRDRDILVTRLIKATKFRPPSSHTLLPSSLLPSSPHSSALSLPSPNDAPKLAHAQAELQACEQHLAQRQRALEELTRAAIARGVLRRSKAMEELGEACRLAGGRARGALGVLVPAQYLNGSSNPLDKPLPNPSPYTSRPFLPRPSSPPGTDSSLSPSQSASQIATYAPQHRLSLQYTPPQPQLERRLSMRIPPAHALSAERGWVPESEMLALPPPPPPTQPPQGRQQTDDSDSDDPPDVIVHENPRASISFPASLPTHVHSTPPKPKPAMVRRASSKHEGLPSTQSDLGPPPQQQGSPFGTARPRPGASTLRARRRPSSRSLDSFPLDMHLTLPTAQQQGGMGKKRGFFGTIAHALHLGSSRGGSSVGGSPMGSPAIGGGGGGGVWGSTRRAGAGEKGGWTTRTDRVLARQRGGGRGGESSDEDVAIPSRLAVVANPAPGLPVVRQRSPPRDRDTGTTRTKRLTKHAAGAGAGAGSTPMQALERRLDAASSAGAGGGGGAETRRSRTLSTPGERAGGGGAGVGRVRTISEASGVRKSALLSSSSAAPSTPAVPGQKPKVPPGTGTGTGTGKAVARSGTVRSTGGMSTATAAPTRTGAGAGLARAGSTMSAPSGGVKKRSGAAASSAATVGIGSRPTGTGTSVRQQHPTQTHAHTHTQSQQGRTRDVVGGASILTVMGEPAQAHAPKSNGLLEIKAPPRVVRDPNEGLVVVRAPPPSSSQAPAPAPPPSVVAPPSQSQKMGNGTTTTTTAPSHSHSSASSHEYARQKGEIPPSHHPVPSRSAPKPGRSALRAGARTPSPVKRALSPMVEEVGPVPPLRQPATAPVQAVAPTARTPSAAVTNAAASGWRESISDDTSSYETGLEDQDEDDGGEETSVEGTPVMRASRVLEDVDRTPTLPPPPTTTTAMGGSEVSGTTESTVVGGGGEGTTVARRKSVRLDVPPSLTSTPADVSSASPWSDPAPPPPPPHSPVPISHSPLGWTTRTSTGGAEEESSDEDEEYARVKRELESVNRRWAKAGEVGRRRGRA